jgi:hypothetical protein
MTRLLLVLPLFVLPFPALAEPITMLAGAASALAGSGSVLGTIGTIASLGGAVVSGIGQMRQGQAAEQNARFQAQQLEQRAGQERASSQRVAIEERRRANIAGSNLQASAAASGGGAADPTVLNLAGGLAKQGQLNAMTALFEGEERATASEFQAQVTRADGKAAARAGRTGMISTIAGGVGSTLMSKYGQQPSSSLPWQSPGNVRPSWAGGGYYG